MAFMDYLDGTLWRHPKITNVPGEPGLFVRNETWFETKGSVFISNGKPAKAAYMFAQTRPDLNEMVRLLAIVADRDVSYSKVPGSRTVTINRRVNEAMQLAWRVDPNSSFDNVTLSNVKKRPEYLRFSGSQIFQFLRRSENGRWTSAGLFALDHYADQAVPTVSVASSAGAWVKPLVQALQNEQFFGNILHNERLRNAIAKSAGDDTGLTAMAVNSARGLACSASLMVGPNCPLVTDRYKTLLSLNKPERLMLWMSHLPVGWTVASYLSDEDLDRAIRNQPEAFL